MGLILIFTYIAETLVVIGTLRHHLHLIVQIAGIVRQIHQSGLLQLILIAVFAISAWYLNTLFHTKKRLVLLESPLHLLIFVLDNSRMEFRPRSCRFWSALKRWTTFYCCFYDLVVFGLVSRMVFHWRFVTYFGVYVDFLVFEKIIEIRRWKLV